MIQKGASMVPAQPTRVSALFQVITFAGMMVIFWLIMYRPAYKFHSFDPRPFIIPNQQLPGATPAKIRIGMHIRSFSRTDILQNELGFEGTIWFNFNEQEVSLADIEKFTIEKGEILERSAPSISHHNDMTLAQFYVCARFKTTPNYRSYPLDDHSLFIIITNQLIRAEHAIFETQQNNFTKAPDVTIPNFNIEKLSFETGYTETSFPINGREETVRHPRAIFTVECNRIDIRHFLIIFLPLVLIFFFTLFAFSVDEKTNGIKSSSLAISGIPALISWRFVIESLSPNANYFMLSDYLFFLFLVLVFIVFIFTTDVPITSLRTKQGCIILLYLLMLGSCYWLFHRLL